MVVNKNIEDKHRFTKVDLVAESKIKKEKVNKKTISNKSVNSVLVPKIKKTEKKVVRVKKTNEKMKRELREIYENSDGTMPNMASFKKRKKRGFFSALFILLFACVFLGAVAWVGFFVFQPMLQFAEEDVTLSISGDENIMSGQEVKYRVRFHNAQNVALGKQSG